MLRVAAGLLLTFYLGSSREEDFLLFFFLGRRRGLGGGNRFNKGGLGRVGTSYRTREHGEVLAGLYPGASAHCTCWWSLHAAVNQGRHAGLRRRRWGWATVLHGSVQWAGWRDGVLEGRGGGHVARAWKGARGTCRLSDGCTSGPSIKPQPLFSLSGSPSWGEWAGASGRGREGKKEGV